MVGEQPGLALIEHKELAASTTSDLPAFLMVPWLASKLKVFSGGSGGVVVAMERQTL